MGLGSPCMRRMRVGLSGKMAAAAVAAVVVLGGCGSATNGVFSGHSVSTGATPPSQPAGAVLFGNQVTAALPSMGPAPSAAALTAWDLSVTLVRFGTSGRIGSGEDALIPARGDHFVIAEVALGSGESGAVAAALGQQSGSSSGSSGTSGGPGGSANSVLSVVVGGAQPTKLDFAAQASSGSLPLVVSVPMRSQSVSLQLIDGKLSESLNLVTGKADTSGLPVVLGRSNVNAGLNTSLNLAYMEAYPGGSGDAETTTYTFGPAFLTYFDQDGNVLAPAPTEAELVLQVTVQASDSGFVPPPASLSLALPDGTKVTATDGSQVFGADVSNEPVYLFTVPATMTTGTVTYTPATFTDPSGDSYTFGNATLTVPINVPTSNVSGG